MNFPSDMTFEYFLLSNYPGCFLQGLPIALLAGVIYLIIQAIRGSDAPRLHIWLSTLFVTYFVGLICLVCLFRGISELWYSILYPNGPGLVIKNYALKSGANFFPTFTIHMSAEKVANFLMFFPFGFLFPFFWKKATWKKTILYGFLLSVVIEVTQPLLNRFFDVDDIIMNVLGVFVAASFAYLIFDFPKEIKKKGARPPDANLSFAYSPCGVILPH